MCERCCSSIGPSCRWLSRDRVRDDEAAAVRRSRLGRRLLCRDLFAGRRQRPRLPVRTPAVAASLSHDNAGCGDAPLLHRGARTSAT